MSSSAPPANEFKLEIGLSEDVLARRRELLAEHGLVKRRAEKERLAAMGLSKLDQLRALKVDDAVKALLAQEAARKGAPLTKVEVDRLKQATGKVEIERFETNTAKSVSVGAKKARERFRRKLEQKHAAADEVSYADMTPKEKKQAAKQAKEKAREAHYQRKDAQSQAKHSYTSKAKKDVLAQYSKQFELMNVNWNRWQLEFDGVRATGAAALRAWSQKALEANKERSRAGRTKTEDERKHEAETKPIVHTWESWNEERRAKRMADVIQLIRYSSDRWKGWADELRAKGVISSVTGTEYPKGTPFLFNIIVPGEAVWEHLFRWMPTETTFMVREDVEQRLEQSVHADDANSVRYWKMVLDHFDKCDPDEAFCYTMEVRNDPLTPREEISKGKRYGVGTCTAVECNDPARIAPDGRYETAPHMCGGCQWYVLAKTKTKGCGFCQAVMCSQGCKNTHYAEAHPERCKKKETTEDVAESLSQLELKEG